MISVIYFGIWDSELCLLGLFSFFNCLFITIGILDTETFVWSRLRVSGTPPQPRYSHTANISGPDIVYFGGWTLISGDRG